MITVAVPKRNDFESNVAEMKAAGMHYVPERKCWVGEIAGECYEDVMTVVGEFVCEIEECPFPKSWSKDKLLKRIDQCADFKEVR